MWTLIFRLNIKIVEGKENSKVYIPAHGVNWFQVPMFVSTNFGEDWSKTKEKWQQCFEIKDSGRYLVLWLLRIFDVTDAF